MNQCSHWGVCFIFISKGFILSWGDSQSIIEWVQLQIPPPRKLNAKWVKFHHQVWTGDRDRQLTSWSQLRDLAEATPIDVSPKGTGNVCTPLYVHKSNPSIEEGLNLFYWTLGIQWTISAPHSFVADFSSSFIPSSVSVVFWHILRERKRERGFRRKLIRTLSHPAFSSFTFCCLLLSKLAKKGLHFSGWW